MITIKVTLPKDLVTPELFDAIDVTYQDAHHRQARSTALISPWPPEPHDDSVVLEFES